VQELNYADNQTFQWYSGYQTLRGMLGVLKSPLIDLEPRARATRRKAPQGRRERLSEERVNAAHATV
jgi:hypothetical protein